MDYKFKIGDKIRFKEWVNEDSNNYFPGIGIFQGRSDSSSSLVAIERLDGEEGSAQNGWWDFCVEDMGNLELAKKPSRKKYILSYLK